MSTSANVVTREIPADEWRTFFEDFSRQHQGWIVAVEGGSTDFPEQQEISGLPLVGIAADTKAGENQLTVTIGGTTDADVNHIVHLPSHVWFRHSALEQYDALELEAKDGTKSVMNFRFVPVHDSDHQLPEVRQPGSL